MKKIINYLDEHHVKYYECEYGDEHAIMLRSKNWKLYIYKDDKGYVADLQKIPYLYGRMGSTSYEYVIKDINDYFMKGLFK